MAHKGKVHSLPDDQNTDIMLYGAKLEEIRYPYGEVLFCDACGEWWDSHMTISEKRAFAAECRAVCRYCDKDVTDHASGHCLFGPTKYERKTYTLKHVP